jgi:drug/metabolite transporter (DMT)-like permease
MCRVQTVTPSRTRTVVLTIVALLAFAGNSLLCRRALTATAIDPATFTTIRIVSGAVVLLILAVAQGKRRNAVSADDVDAHAPPRLIRGSWPSAAALALYAIGFSLAYVQLTAGTGALLLFGAVQASMISWSLLRGERLAAAQWCGLLIAYGGLIALVLPGLTAPPLAAALLMLTAGAAWAVYTVRGKGAAHPIAVNAGNFGRAVPFALVTSAAYVRSTSVDTGGVWLAIASGALTSGLGYAVWYAVLPRLRGTIAATVQLAVPAMTAVGGVVLLGEALSVRLVACAAAILGGVALVLRSARPGVK